jgi:hypothetical protein
VGYPITAEQMQGFFGKRNIAVTGPFAPVNVNLHPILISIGYLQVQGLLKPQPAGIHRGRVSMIVKRADMTEDAVNLLPAEDTGKTSFLL